MKALPEGEVSPPPAKTGMDAADQDFQSTVDNGFAPSYADQEAYIEAQPTSDQAGMIGSSGTQTSPGGASGTAANGYGAGGGPSGGYGFSGGIGGATAPAPAAPAPVAAPPAAVVSPATAAQFVNYDSVNSYRQSRGLPPVQPQPVQAQPVQAQPTGIGAATARY